MRGRLEVSGIKVKCGKTHLKILDGTEENSKAVLECGAAEKNTLLTAQLDDFAMKDFFLNFTRIVENNPRIYWSIILGIAGCLVLFVAEIVHVQNILADLHTKDQNLMRAAIEPISSQYKWSRIVVIIAAVLWSNFEYLKSKKKLGL